MVRVLDLFRDWDDDNTGNIEKREFRKALGTLTNASSRCALSEADDDACSATRSPSSSTASPAPALSSKSCEWPHMSNSGRTLQRK